MQDLKIAIALDARDCEELSDKGFDRIFMDRMAKGMSRTESRDGNSYRVFLWDWECPDGLYEDDRWTRFLKAIESRGHARIEISEDGTIFSDVETETAWGTDDNFELILGWRTEICLWMDTAQPMI